MPDGAFYLWSIFRRLSLRRSSNGFGANPLTWPEIEAFNRLSGLDLQPWEIEVIEHVDGVFLDQQAKEASKT